MHINEVALVTNARDETLMEVKRSLDTFGGHIINVSWWRKKPIFISGRSLPAISTKFIAESLSNDRSYAVSQVTIYFTM
jgi:hypothetical protein